MRRAMTMGVLTLGSMLVLLAPTTASAARWNVALDGSVVHESERTTRTPGAGDCTLERTERTSERWRWTTPAPVAVSVRRGAGGQVELSRGALRGTVRIAVVASASATSTVTSSSNGSSPGCAPGFGSSSLCEGARPWTELWVTLRWNARSGRLETAPPAAAPAALRRRLGGCGAALGRESLAERPFATLTTSRAVGAASLLTASGPFARQAEDVARRGEPGGSSGSEKRTVRAELRLTPAG